MFPATPHELQTPRPYTGPFVSYQAARAPDFQASLCLLFSHDRLCLTCNGASDRLGERSAAIVLLLREEPLDYFFAITLNIRYPSGLLLPYERCAPALPWTDGILIKSARRPGHKIQRRSASPRQPECRVRNVALNPVPPFPNKII